MALLADDVGLGKTISAGLVASELISRGRVKKLLITAMERAEESPQPDPATLLDGVYATPEDLDTPHHK